MDMNQITKEQMEAALAARMKQVLFVPEHLFAVQSTALGFKASSTELTSGKTPETAARELLEGAIAHGSNSLDGRLPLFISDCQVSQIPTNWPVPRTALMCDVVFGLHAEVEELEIELAE
jgi:hypothetical protein